MPLPIVNSGGSGAGVSMHKAWEECPRQAYYKARDRGKVDDAGGAAQVGTYFHHLCELYYGNRNEEIEVSDVQYNEEFEEAQRLWVAYRKEHSGREWWGEVLGTETRFPRMTPEDTEESWDREVLDTFFPGLTMQLDLLLAMTSESVRRIGKRYNLPVEAGKIYVLDWKTRSRKENFDLKYKRDPQFKVYQTAVSKILGVELAGTIVLNVIRHKNLSKDSFVANLIPTPSQVEMEIVKEWLSGHDFNDLRRNIGTCYNWGRICAWESECWSSL